MIQAFTRKAHAKERKEESERMGKSIKFPHQDTFRVLGDAVLKAALVDLLLKNENLDTRGKITEEKKQFESTEGLHKMAKELEIAGFILMSRGEEIENVQERPRVQAETMEALVGAIYRDRGFESTKEKVRTWFGL